jgi:hypothetical protein
MSKWRKQHLQVDKTMILEKIFCEFFLVHQYEFCGLVAIPQKYVLDCYLTKACYSFASNR